jgi:hypothetical protein
MSVTDLRDLFEELAATPGPPTRSTAEATYAVGRRRWRRRRAVTAATATMLAAVTAAGIAATAIGLRPDPVAPPVSAGIVAPEPGIVRWAGAADADHLYLAYFACRVGPSCPKTRVRIVGSDDGGQTWTQRSAAVDLGDITVLGPGLLVGHGSAQPNGPTLSADGGRTWRPLTVADRPAPAVPAGGGLICLSTSAQPPADCGLYAVDPAAGTASRLVARPTVVVPDQDHVTTAGGAIWLGGMGDGWPAVAVSRDGGRNWSTFTLTGTGTRRYEENTLVEVTTVDGYSVYAVAIDTAAKRRVVFRGTIRDGFERARGAEKVPYSYVGGPSSFVLADGTHVMQQILSDRPVRDRVRYWVGEGLAYRPVQLDGLPDTVYPVRRTPDGFYYTHTYGDPHGQLYGSADGRHWTRMNQP